MPVRIGHASISENGNAGWDGKAKAGDQTSKEVKISNWYNGNWNVVLRPKSSILAEKSASANEKLCKCNLVGYDQSQRNTLHDEMRKVGYDVDKYISNNTKTEVDCSSFQHLLAIIGGVIELEYSGNALVCANMKNAFQKTGKYDIITDSKYLDSSDYLKRGDVLIKKGHTVMVLDNGPKALADSPNNSLAESNASSKPKFVVGRNYSLLVELKVRTDAGTNYPAKKHSQLTEGGKKCDKDGDGALDKGTVVTCQKVKNVGNDIWIKCPSGWLAAYYNGKVYIK